MFLFSHCIYDKKSLSLSLSLYIYIYIYIYIYNVIFNYLREIELESEISSGKVDNNEMYLKNYP